MLKGKILTIKFTGHWVITIDGFTKTFVSWPEVEIYIKRVIDKGKDSKKKALLAKDSKCLLIWTP